MPNGTSGEQRGQNALDLEMLEELVNLEETAWEYIERVRMIERMADRQRFYDGFIARVALTPPAEQDSLLAHGQSVWGYRIDTARQAVAALREQSVGNMKIATTVTTPEFLADIIWTGELPRPVKYAVYRFEEGEVEVVDQITYDGVLYRPPQSKLFEKGTITIPSGSEEYRQEGEAEPQGQRRLFEQVRAFLADLNYVPEGKGSCLDLDAAMIFLTWVFDKFKSIPYWHIEGDYGSGKTRRLETVALCCYRVIRNSASITSAPIFRLIELYKPTFAVDEADFQANDDVWKDIAKILNAGNRVNAPVIRCRDKTTGYEPESYDTYCPKLVATRKPFPSEALQSRCFKYVTELVSSETLERAGIPLELSDEHYTRAARLRNQLLLWRFRHHQEIQVDPNERVEGVEPRVQQLAQPLLALFPDDEGIKDALRQHVRAHGAEVKESRQESLEGRILRELYRRCRAEDFEERWTTAEVTRLLNVNVLPMQHVTETAVGIRIGHLGFEKRRTATGHNIWPFDERNQENLYRKGREYGWSFRFPVP